MRQENLPFETIPVGEISINLHGSSTSRPTFENAVHYQRFMRFVFATLTLLVLASTATQLPVYELDEHPTFSHTASQGMEFVLDSFFTFNGTDAMSVMSMDQ